MSMVMQYPHQCCLWWGKDLTLIYNAAYGEVIHKHPVLFGMSGPVAWAGMSLQPTRAECRNLELNRATVRTRFERNARVQGRW